MTNLKKCLKFLIAFLSIIIIIINITLVIKSKINKNEIPDFMGYTPFIIVSGSMEPKIPVNDIIVTKKVNSENIKIGDIISYKDYTQNIIITHRVSEILNKEGKTYYITKGDRNSMPDKNNVEYSQIQGKYLFTVPLLGKVVSFITTLTGAVVTLTFILGIYIIYEVAVRKNIRTNTRKMIRYRALRD